jgi:hypothetical protein
MQLVYEQPSVYEYLMKRLRNGLVGQREFVAAAKSIGIEDQRITEYIEDLLIEDGVL